MVPAGKLAGTPSAGFKMNGEGAETFPESVTVMLTVCGEFTAVANRLPPVTVEGTITATCVVVMLTMPDSTPKSTTRFVAVLVHSTLLRFCVKLPLTYSTKLPMLVPLVMAAPNCGPESVLNPDCRLVMVGCPCTTATAAKPRKRSSEIRRIDPPIANTSNNYWV